VEGTFVRVIDALGKYWMCKVVGVGKRDKDYEIDAGGGCGSEV